MRYWHLSADDAKARSVVIADKINLLKALLVALMLDKRYVIAARFEAGDNIVETAGIRQCNNHASRAATAFISDRSAAGQRFIVFLKKGRRRLGFVPPRYTHVE